MFGALVARRPSLDWLLGKLTDEWPHGDDKISCPLPDHNDDTPSFNLWDHDEEGIPQRWGCFGCGRGGDALDLIMLVQGVDSATSIRLAEQYADDEAAEGPRERHAPTPKEPERPLPELLAQFEAGMDANRLATFTRYMMAKGLGGEELETFAMEQWGWTVGDNGAVAIPHKDPEGTPIGIKYRTPQRKWTENGSHFTSLFGAWRDKKHPRVVICEGETDALWASWSLRNEDIDVFAMPSGAQQEIQAEWLEQLRGREVTLAMDCDGAGMDAARQWVAVRPDALLARLPDGEDLLSCGLPVRDVLTRAESPRRDSGLIVVDNGVFSKQTPNGAVAVADFAFVPEHELFTDEGPAWDVQLTGDRRTVLVRAADLHSTGSFTRWANRNGVAWMGTGQASQGVYNWLKTQSSYLPLERAVTRAGKVGRSFVGPGFCIGPDRLRYIPPALGDAKLDSRLLIHEGTWDPRTLLALERLNDPTVMASIIGWLCATLMRGERAPAPPLFISGESGAGKTSMLQALLGSFGFNTETNLTTTTPYGVDCMVNSSIGFPVWFDEFRGGAREDSMGRLRQILRDAYFGQPSMKGGMSQQATELTEIKTWAGIIVSGEMGSTETSHRDRIVMIDLDPAAQNRGALLWLQDKRMVDGLGYDLLDFLARREDALFQWQPLGDPELPERFRNALGFVNAGWNAWKEFRWAHGLRDTPAAPNFAHLAKERSVAVDPWLEAIRACEGVQTRDGTMIVEQFGDDVFIIPSEVVMEARRVGIELPARANELISWLRRRHQVDDIRIGSRRGKRIVGMTLEEA